MRESTAFLIGLQSAYNTNDVLDSINTVDRVETLYNVEFGDIDTVALVVYHEISRDYDVMVLKDMRQPTVPTKISEVPDYDWNRFENTAWLPEDRYEYSGQEFKAESGDSYLVMETISDIAEQRQAEAQPGYEDVFPFAYLQPNGDVQDASARTIGDIQAFGKYVPQD